MDKDCPHLIPDENWKCEDCGADIPPPDLAPDWKPNLGRVAQISLLFDATCKQFEKLIKANSDPENPTQPKLRIVGGLVMRLPHKMVIQGMVGPSYIKAKSLGFRGTQKRWQEMIYDDLFPTPEMHGPEILG